MRSIELNWLARKSKWLRLPKLKMISGGFHESTCYFRPDKKVYTFPWGVDSGPNGIIVINTDTRSSSELLREALAHEWRHHMQYFSGIKLGESGILSEKLQWDYSNWEKIYRKILPNSYRIGCTHIFC